MSLSSFSRPEAPTSTNLAFVSAAAITVTATTLTPYSAPRIVGQPLHQRGLDLAIQDGQPLILQTTNSV